MKKQPSTPLNPHQAVEASFPAFLEAAPDAMVLVGPDGRIRCPEPRWRDFGRAG